MDDNPENPFWGAPCRNPDHDGDWWTDEPRRKDPSAVKKEKNRNRQTAIMLCETACRCYVQCARRALSVPDTQGTFAGVFLPPASRHRDKMKRDEALTQLEQIAGAQKMSGAA